MKLYKFRPLADENDLKYVIKLIKTGKFWCSKLWNLNDPMEGVYKSISFNKENSARIFSEKNNFIICSFSGVDALKNPLLWGYYANGFRGIVIEIEIADTKVEKVKYSPRIIFSNDLNDVREIIITKLDNWKHEDEYRFLKESSKEGSHKIGEIKKVYFGSPYSNVHNIQNVEKNSRTIRKYNYLKRELQIECEKKGIKPEDIDID